MIEDGVNSGESRNEESGDRGGLAGFSPFHPLFAPLGLSARRALSLVERESDFSAAKWFVLAILERRDGLSKGEVARSFELDPSRVTRVGQALEAEGYVRRERSPEDNRVVRMHLTEAGRRKLSELPEVREEVHRRVRGALSDEELRELERMLGVLADALRE